MLNKSLGEEVEKEVQQNTFANFVQICLTLFPRELPEL